MSYAEAAAKGPKQTPEEAAAPQPPQLEQSTSISTASLIDVDTPSVRTVPSDFGEQEVQTETQAARREREERELEQAAAKARAEADLAKKKAKSSLAKADSWLTKKFAGMSDNGASALLVGNLLAAVGLTSFLGYKAWGLHEKGRLDWKIVGLGVGVLGAVGAFEGVIMRYFYKTKGNKKH